MLWQINGDARQIPLRDESVQCVVTSPPYYGLRNYQIDGQIGLEKTYIDYVETIVNVFREVRRVLKGDGTVWLNIGDSYAGSSMSGGSQQSSTLVGTHHEDRNGCRFNGTTRGYDGLKPKDLIGIPWRIAFALQADGWWLRQDIIWSKPNPMPESVSDRCTKAHEYLFLLAKSERYYYNADAIKESAVHAGKVVTLGEKSLSKGQARGAGVKASGNGNADSVVVAADRNRRSVWTIATQPTRAAHFATFPEALVRPCILAGSRPGDLVLDPFAGTGTVGKVAVEHGRKAVMVELKREYLLLDRKKRHPQIGMGI